MEKFMQIRDKKGVVNTIYHGDEIYAAISSNDPEEEAPRIWVMGKLCLNDNVSAYQHGGHMRGWICQDKQSGCEDAQEKFEYQYSWTFSVGEEGNVEASDTFVVIPLRKKDELTEPVACLPCTDHRFNIALFTDEEQMPEDWVMTDIIPQNL